MNAHTGSGQHHDHGRGHGPNSGDGHSHDHAGVHATDSGHDNGRAHSHSHSHGNTATDLDWEALATHLETNGELHLPAYRHTAARLRDLLGPDHRVRRVLDVGSGPGVMTCVFAEAFPHAEVEALGYEVAAYGTGRWNGVAVISRVGLEDVTRGLTGEPGFQPEDAMLEAH